MVTLRPSREEILAGIGYEPIVFPVSVPEEVREAENRDLEEYLVGWALDAWDHVTAYEATHQKAAGSGDLAKHSYGCTMVDIDPAGEIGDMMAELRGDIDRDDLAGQGLEPESHVTVRYGILPGSDLAGLRQYLRSLEPFEIRFGAVASFPPTQHSDNAAVLKVEVSSPVLEEINAAMVQHVSFKPANFEYHSHATLAYVKPGTEEKYVGNDLLAGQTMEVTSIAISMPGIPREIVPLLGEPAPWHDEPEAKKMDLVATEYRCSKRLEEPGVAQARHEIQATLQHFFTKTANAIAATIRNYQKVAKASGADSLMNQLPGIDWEGVVPSLAINLKKISKAGAARAISSLNIDASRMIWDINEVAADWAEQRAAEMVGMRRLPSGKLVQNPDAQWNIQDKTRDELRDIITEAFEKKTSMTELSQEIQQAGVFSESRAALIAKTETIRAENQGNLAGWKHSGMVELIDIFNSADHDDSAECECTEAAENGPYPPDQVPELPLHPGCECDYVVAQLVGQGDD